MKLLFCIKSINNPGGGAERVLVDVANGLCGRGHTVSVLSFDPSGEDPFYDLNPGIERIELGIGSTTNRATVGCTFRRMKALRSRIKSHAPDVTIGFMHSMFIPLGVALLGTSIPVIASEHTVPRYYNSRPLEAFLLCLTPLIAQRITCVSEQVKQAFPFFLARKMTVIPNPVTARSSVMADVLGRPNRRRIILAIGTLTQLKNHVTLIQAFARIADEFPEWDVRIVGEGHLRPLLESKVKELRLSRRIHFAGAVKDVSKEYLGAQLFVQPSYYESFGLTVAEAMAHGLPAVGFEDCQGVNQLIQPGVNGVLVQGQRDRVAALAETLINLMRDGALREKLAKGAIEAAKYYSLETILDQWEDLIARVVKRKDPEI